MLYKKQWQKKLNLFGIKINDIGKNKHSSGNSSETQHLKPKNRNLKLENKLLFG